MRLPSLVLCWSACALMAAPAAASPILYTDRAAFELAADPNHLITFEGSAAVVEINQAFLTYLVTFDGLLKFNFDWISGVGWSPGDTYVVLGRSGLLSSGGFLEPVYAFGFDVLDFGLTPSGAISGAGSDFNFIYRFSAPGFIGVVSDKPIIQTSISYNQTPPVGTYAIDNVLVRTVPDEGNTFPVLLLAVGALMMARRVNGKSRHDARQEAVRP